MSRVKRKNILTWNKQPLNNQTSELLNFPKGLIPLFPVSI